ncbi:MAG: glycosyltransferase family 2 protein, partial [Bulleidia sp.]
MKVSVVVPVYNAERYLAQSIDSVVKQTFSDWELLLINDGSSDSSEEICRACCEKDQRIHLITQKNGGPARAIGTGIQSAQGKYLMFLDADDWYEPEMLKVMTTAMDDSASDAVLCGYWKVFPNGRKVLGNPV